MRIDERIAHGAEPSFSFEFFPPKTDEGERNLGRALAELSRLSPTFVSVTYGAGGSTTEKRKTIDIVAHLKRDYGMEAMAHFTCVGADRGSCARCSTRCATPASRTCSRCAATRRRARASGPRPRAGCSFSRELIELIRDEYDFSIGAACFPEVHIHATDAESDLRYLKEKVDAGARFLITQLFFDNQAYYDFVARARDARHRRPDRPGHHADHRRAPDQAHHGDVRREDPGRLLRELELRGDEPAR